MSALTLTFALALTALAQTAAPTVADVAWISGCWELSQDGRRITEQWMPPDGGTLLGMSRTVAGGKTVEWEFLLIRQGTSGLEYVAKPARQAEAVFTAAAASPARVVFENPSHDFPTRIIYERSEHMLTAAIEGQRNGQTRRIEYPYKKTACGS